jgi:hypothetical protein
MLCDASSHGARDSLKAQDSGRQASAAEALFDSDLTFLVTFTKIMRCRRLPPLWPAHLGRWRPILLISWAPGGSHFRTISPWICLGRPHPLPAKALRALSHRSVR